MGSYANINNEIQMATCIYHALKPGGYVIFIENMIATRLHSFLRKKFRPHGKMWHYQSDTNIKTLFKGYNLQYNRFFGFFGLFGPNELIRKILGKIDMAVELVVPNRWKYIGVYVFKK